MLLILAIRFRIINIIFLMGSSCFKQNENPHTTQQTTGYKNVREDHGLLKTTHSDLQEQSRRGQLETPKIKYGNQLKQKKIDMIERQKKVIREKQQAISAIQAQITGLEASGNRDEVKALKLKRQLKVQNDLILQHKKNIEKIQKS